MLMYLMFRAHTQNIPEDDHNYEILQHGMIVATIGLIIHIADALSFRIQSEAFGNVSEVLGNVLLTVGSVFLVWGALVVRSTFQSLEVSGKCLVAVCVLGLAVLIATKILDFIGSKQPGSSIDLVRTRWLENIRTTISFAPLLAIAFLYSYFSHLNKTFPEKAENTAMILCVVGLYVQVAASSKLIPWGSLLIQSLASVLTYASYVVLLYVLIEQQPQSPATWNVLVILLAVSVIRLVITALQEASSILFEDLDDEFPSENTRAVLAVIKLFQNMSVAASMAEILSILFLYVHLRAEFFLGENPASYIKGIWYLGSVMCLATGALFSKIILLVLGFVVGHENRWLAMANSMAVAVMNTCLFVVFVSALL